MKGVYGETAIVLENADGKPTPRPVRTFEEDEGGLVVSSRGCVPQEDLLWRSGGWFLCLCKERKAKVVQFDLLVSLCIVEKHY
jgi:hypothetical protein